MEVTDALCGVKGLDAYVYDRRQMMRYIALWILSRFFAQVRLRSESTMGWFLSGILSEKWIVTLKHSDYTFRWQDTIDITSFLPELLLYGEGSITICGLWIWKWRNWRQLNQRFLLVHKNEYLFILLLLCPFIASSVERRDRKHSNVLLHRHRQANELFDQFLLPSLRRYNFDIFVLVAPHTTYACNWGSILWNFGVNVASMTLSIRCTVTASSPMLQKKEQSIYHW